jgi:hypothetical protein
MPPLSIPVKFVCARQFVLVVVFFDHFLYQKSPVYDTNLHQNIFSRKSSQNQFGDTMKKEKNLGWWMKQALFYKSELPILVPVV